MPLSHCPGCGSTVGIVSKVLPTGVIEIFCYACGAQTTVKPPAPIVEPGYLAV